MSRLQYVDEWKDFWLPSENLYERYDWKTVFDRVAPTEVELGAGDGNFITEWAKRFPERNFVALERLLGRARKIVKKSSTKELTNVRTLHLESFYFSKWLCFPESVSVFHIMFPDPWPKKKHHKNRLIQPEFLQALHEALEPEGLVRFSTDHEEYFQWTLEVFQQESKNWREVGAWDASNDPKSEFQLLFEGDEKVTYRNCWKKVSQS